MSVITEQRIFQLEKEIANLREERDDWYQDAKNNNSMSTIAGADADALLDMAQNDKVAEWKERTKDFNTKYANWKYGENSEVPNINDNPKSREVAILKAKSVDTFEREQRYKGKAKDFSGMKCQQQIEQKELLLKREKKEITPQDYLKLKEKMDLRHNLARAQKEYEALDNQLEFTEAQIEFRKLLTREIGEEGYKDYPPTMAELEKRKESIEKDLETVYGERKVAREAVDNYKKAQKEQTQPQSEKTEPTPVPTFEKKFNEQGQPLNAVYIDENNNRVRAEVIKNTSGKNVLQVKTGTNMTALSYNGKLMTREVNGFVREPTKEETMHYQKIADLAWVKEHTVDWGDNPLAQAVHSQEQYSGAGGRPAQTRNNVSDMSVKFTQTVPIQKMNFDLERK